MTGQEQLTDNLMERVEARNAGQTEFLQAVRDVARDVMAVEKNNARWSHAKVLERLTEPDRVIGFRVAWMDDHGDVQINRGWRVQTSNAIGPYKGGLRFHPSVNPSVLKFLGFEQVFKNALTGLPLGGAKGGSDFDPNGRSDAEIMRFCQAFMLELARYIGPDVDVPAGDINVGTREIGWLFGTYKKVSGASHGALTGKGHSFGGSAMRVEATGYGLIYFVQAMLAQSGSALDGKRVVISGKGNVATHAAEKATCEGAKVVCLSDTSGVLHAPDGMSHDAITWVRDRKAQGADISDPPKALDLSFDAGSTPWSVAEHDIALPCATQNEVDAKAAKDICAAGATLLAEGANMPLQSKALEHIRTEGLMYAPGKASNAGGVAISGLEMSQNAHRRFNSAEEIDAELKSLMGDIHARLLEEAGVGKTIDYARSANIAAYRRVADAVTALGTAA
ncbi:NADP-specific glutamate dehydrogenase [Roseobacter denitrificans]|uniref:Glutamate dehydrogenase n=1 Tax=Roseobacter denitrificans (strain ATCC 33942 / OCh 114) TaxID=375451 RepID=Q166S7_ROSDO|nr:NADP-specific glutamate dehydrogenase [Roseobacter denitrificans]ABG32016.1 glutamate dehydrogenase [Roseobacter denitrificans OCh 114]AVL51547.1 NADP-specific glutamate dehydrogenase [Roseobacter denitrificans]SFG36372.1 glutamate dehydrogenase (NADP+) [Roseobacter denitrificans OCh 114]